MEEEQVQEAAPQERIERRCDRKTIVKAKKKTCGSATFSPCGRCSNHCRGYADIDGRRVTCPEHM